MLERVSAMEQEMNAMIESVRTGSNRLNADLQQLESGLSDVSSAIAPRPEFVPDAPAADTFAVPAPACTNRRRSMATPPASISLSPASCRSRNSPRASSPPSRWARSRAAEAPPEPEAAQYETVAGEFQGVAADSGHSNGFDQPQPVQQGGDAEGARLIALNMALNGTPREETDRYL